MRKSGRLFIVIGVALALVAAALAIVAFQGNKGNKQQVQQPLMASVVVTSRAIPANTVITQDDVQVAHVDKSTIAPGAASSTGQVIGLASSGNMVRGQQILSANLTTPGLNFDLTNGKLAVALPVDRVNALGGLIQPDDHIDLIYSTRVKLTVPGDSAGKTSTASTSASTSPYPGDPGSLFTVQESTAGDPTTKLIVQNVRVLRVVAGNVTVNGSDSTGTSSTTTKNASGTPTAPQTAAEKLPNSDLLVLEVDPQQAEVINFLQDNGGQYQVALRAQGDNGPATTKGVTYDQLVTEYGLPVPKTVALPGGGQ